MINKLKIKLYKKKYLYPILKLIRQSDHTNRTATTWNNNNMTAILAIKENLLIGAIPFEQHDIKISDNQYVRGLWVSGAFVKKKFRNYGIGSLLDLEVRKLLPQKKIIMVMRHDEGTAAYRWYIKNGYTVISEILSLKMPIRKNILKNNQDYKILKVNDVRSYAKNLLKIFERYNSKKNNFPKRSLKYWENKMLFHYYKNFYKFYIILAELNSKKESFALIGETSIKDGIHRIDILEVSCDSCAKNIKNLFDKIHDFGNKRGVQEIRTQQASCDELSKLAINYGFVERWKTNLMSKSLNKRIKVLKNETRFFQIDYI